MKHISVLLQLLLNIVILLLILLTILLICLVISRFLFYSIRWNNDCITLSIRFYFFDVNLTESVAFVLCYITRWFGHYSKVFNVMFFYSFFCSCPMYSIVSLSQFMASGRLHYQVRLIYTFSKFPRRQKKDTR